MVASFVKKCERTRLAAARALACAYACAAMTEDVLTDVLNTLRVDQAKYGRFEPRAAWKVGIAASEAVCFYAVLAGSCVLEVGSGEPLRLASGDLVVLPHGAPHIVRSEPPASCISHEAVLNVGTAPGTKPPGAASEQTMASAPQPGQRCSRLAHLVSGRIFFSRSHRHHWWSLLPSVVALRGQDRSLPWLESTLQLIESEADSQRPGGQTLVSRLTDLLVLQVLRGHLMQLEPSSDGPNWLGALTEPQIGAALALLHESPERSWTVRSLAQRVGMSRSAFAARFTRLVGQPPLQYLTRLRMHNAAALLSDSFASTSEIAERVGYVSDTAFCKAFKRMFGESPGVYRRTIKLAIAEQAA